MRGLIPAKSGAQVKLIETYSLYDVSTISEPICLSEYGGLLSFGASRTAPLVIYTGGP